MVSNPEWKSRADEDRAHLAAMRQSLADVGKPPRERLTAVAHHFWRAMLYWDTWPELQRSHGAALVATLFRRGPIERTVAMMTDEDVTDALRELAGFCDEFGDRGREA